jgi:hypothetical protein
MASAVIAVHGVGASAYARAQASGAHSDDVAAIWNSVEGLVRLPR